MIWIIAYIISVPICAFLMFALTANSFRSEYNDESLGIDDILYNSAYSSGRQRCVVISLIPIVGLTVIICYCIFQLLNSEIVMSTPIDKFFKRLYHTKHLLNRFCEENKLTLVRIPYTMGASDIEKAILALK
jgi:hypothetical protein